MKATSYFLFLLFFTISLSLKPKPEAEAHLRGKLSQTPSHQMTKNPNHNLKQQLNQHKQNLIGHVESYTTNHHNKMSNTQQNHQLFDHHSSSRSFDHQKKQNHNKQSHDWGSSTTSNNHEHKKQVSKTNQHKKMTKNHKLFDDETTSPTSSSDYRHKKTKLNNEHNKREHDFDSTTTSTMIDSHFHRMDSGQAISARHHQAEVHDEFSQGSEKHLNHRQNDRDEPHNGDRYFYVDQNNIPTHEVDSSSETSSLKQPDLRDYVDYDHPLDPDHPLVQSETNFVTTEVPDTIGAGKGMTFDEDTSVSSSVMSEYQKKKNQAMQMQGNSQETTNSSTSGTALTSNDTATPPSQTTNYVTTATETSNPNGLGQNHRQKRYKYQADAPHTDPNDDQDDDTEDNNEKTAHKAEIKQENHKQYSSSQKHDQTLQKETHQPETAPNHLDYGTSNQSDAHHDHMTTESAPKESI